MKKTVWILLVVAALSGGAAVSAGEPETNAKLAFEQLKSLAGRWETTTPDGKKALLSLEVVANGSALMEREEVEENAQRSSMVTLFHLDGDRLILTHYCMAGNQPRMRVESFDPQKRTFAFTFLDATNLKTPNDGHMRRVVYQIVDENHFHSRWTFYQDQKVAFDEEFRYTRIGSAAEKK